MTTKMQVTVTEYYNGSKLLLPLATRFGVPVDQVNFVFSQASAIVLAFLYRKALSPDRFSPVVRHLASLIPGVVMAFFCFGHQASNLLVLAMISYIAIMRLEKGVVQRVVLLLSILYLSYLHLIRLINDYGGYTLDITGPIMLSVQKVTNVAFSLHDGMGRPERELTPEQKRYAIKKTPSLLEFFSYIFSFQSLMCGPLIYYNDYIEFVEGSDIKRHLKEDDEQKEKDLSPKFAVLEKVSSSTFFALMFITVAPKFPITKLADDNFLASSSIISLTGFILVTTAVARFKYYFAWNLGESICNAGGLGFNGFNRNNRPRYDLAEGLNIFRFEFSVNLRQAIESWNKTTQSWLRRTAYERAPRFRTFATFALSALWHGFYPGYYLTFFTGALYTVAARNARRCIRPMFQKSRKMAVTYDLITIVTTRIMMAYLVFPFVLLELRASINVWARLYFYGHVACLLSIFLLPLIFPSSFKSKAKEKTAPVAADPLKAAFVPLVEGT